MAHVPSNGADLEKWREEASSSHPKAPIEHTPAVGSRPSNNKFASLELQDYDEDSDSTHTLSRPASPGPSEGKPELPSSSSSNPVLQGQGLPDPTGTLGNEKSKKKKKGKK